MKVLQINSVCGIGSTGRIAVDLYKALEKNGHECCIAYGRGTAPEGIKTIKIGKKFHVYYHCLMTRITDRHGFYSKYATKKFIKEAKAFNPDIIHLHNIHGYYINIKLLFEYLKDSGKPVLWTLHDCWPLTGHCSYFDFAGCTRWKKQCYKCPQKSSYPKSLLLDNSYCNFQYKKSLFTCLDHLTLVTPSEWLKNIVTRSYFRNNTCNVIYNGINLDVFHHVESDLRKKYSLDGKKIILGVASVWEERKGLNIFLGLSKKLPTDFQIVLIGLSAKEIKKLPSNILKIKKTKDLNELVSWYSTADVYFNASVEETMGMTTVEALACGTPVLTFNRTAVPELVSESCGKVLSDVKVTAAFKALVDTNWNNYTYDNCRNQAKKYDELTFASKYLEIYNKMP